MKKIYTLIAITAVAFSANAQTKDGMGANEHKATVSLQKHIKPASGTRASGDTLMYMPLPGYTIVSTDAPTFGLATEDIDGLPPNNVGTDMDFGLYYSTDSSIYGSSCATCSTPHGANYYHPWETPAPLGTDTAFFWSATSWFNPAGQADNWLMFGPITIPAGGASLVWYDRTNRYRDGYKVIVADGTGYDASAATGTPLTFTDFDFGTTIYTETDDAYPSATWAVDTTWELHNVMLPASFNGTQVNFAFHHDANDMDVLRLDEITVVDGSLALGLGEHAKVEGISVAQNMPNPFSSKSTISYQLEKSATVVLSVFDVTGKKIAEQAAGEQPAGAHSLEFNADNLSAGVYYYSIKAGDKTSASVKMVVIK
jgi:hypothetical protein